MAANLYFKFRASMPVASEKDSSTFYYYIAYAQGLPLLLCLAVAYIDHFGDCDLILPNMGYAHCFLGSPWETSWINGTFSSSWLNFFYTSEFIYFHSFLIVLQMANITFFCLTVFFLMKHWRLNAELLKQKTRIDFQVVIRLFFVTGEY